jgi:hypothetical protein
MSHFAKVETGIVTRVIVADQEFIDSGAVGDPSDWVKTSYSAMGGEYVDHSTGSVRTDLQALRKNFACVGFSYDKERDAFIPPKPFDSWILDEDSCQWNAPKEKPVDAKYYWNEDKLNWVKVGD